MGINKYNKYTIEKTKLEEYKDVLFKEKCVRHEKKRIQSKSYNLGIYKIKKFYSPCFDDKRYIPNDGNKTLSCGFTDIC